MDPDLGDTTRVRRARVGLMAFFASVGLLAAQLVSRAPTIRSDLDVTPSEFGTVLLVGASGGLVAFAFTGGLVERFGSLAVGRACGMAGCAASLVLGGATALGSPVLYAAGLFAALAGFEILMGLLSAEAATVERWVGRPILSQFHATFSVAMLLGLGIGAAYSFAGVSVAWHFAVNGTVILAVLLIMSNSAFGVGVPPRSAGAHGEFFAGIRSALRERRTLALGLILLCAFTTEAAAGNWIPLSLVDDYGRTEAVASVMYASVLIAQSVTRIVGVRGLERLGRVATLRASSVTIVAGVIVFAFSPAPWIAAGALLVWGIGTAFSFPVALSAAADERTHATARVAAVNVFATAGGLIAPLLIGLLAESVEIRRALLVVGVAAAAIFVLAPAARPPTADARAAWRRAA